jgi:hypothetical protein
MLLKNEKGTKKNDLFNTLYKPLYTNKTFNIIAYFTQKQS